LSAVKANKRVHYYCHGFSTQAQLTLLM